MSPTRHLFLPLGALSEPLKARLVVGDALLDDRLPGLQIHKAVIDILKRWNAAVLRAVVDCKQHILPYWRGSLHDQP